MGACVERSAICTDNGRINGVEGAISDPVERSGCWHPSCKFTGNRRISCVSEVLHPRAFDGIDEMNYLGGSQ